MMKSRLWVILITLLTLAIFQGPCYAHKIGAFDVSLSGALRESFDDNITFTKENKKQDYITAARVGLEAVYEGKTRSLQLSGNILQNTFLDHINFNNLAQDFAVNFINELSKRDRLSLSDSFSRSEEPRNVEDSFGSTAGRYRIQKNEFSLGYAREINSQLIVFFQYIRRKGFNYRNILIVGTGKRAKNFIDIVQSHKEIGFKIIGLVDEDAAKKGETLYGYKVLGTLNNMIEIVHANIVD